MMIISEMILLIPWFLSGF